MPNYIRPKVIGACVFFTVALARRSSDLPVREVDRVRAVASNARMHRYFQIDTFVILRDHIHANWTLPAGDRNFALRWAAIKAQFSMEMGRAG